MLKIDRCAPRTVIVQVDYFFSIVVFPAQRHHDVQKKEESSEQLSVVAITNTLADNTIFLIRKRASAYVHQAKNSSILFRHLGVNPVTA